MRKFIGFWSLVALGFAVIVGILFPQFGADASVAENLIAWVVFIALLWGTFWGLGAVDD